MLDQCLNFHLSTVKNSGKMSFETLYTIAYLARRLVTLGRLATRRMEGVKEGVVATTVYYFDRARVG